MRKNILIIDNDQALNKINEKVLTTADLVSELHIALNGREGIDYIRKRILKNQSLPDLIILDLHLPIMNGMEFLEEFGKIDVSGRNEVELAVFTNSSSPTDRQKALMRGVHHYWSKPYLLRQLMNIMIPRDVSQQSFIITRKKGQSKSA